ncbi:Tudor domain [Trinorchestia longiramus]|nr:Tudor domain [Trinorchestia longiramus]
MFSSLGNMSKLAKLTSVAALAGVSAGLYFLMRKWDSDWCTVVIEVPTEVAGRVIGRKGANIKLIEAKSQTKIHFENFDDNTKSDKRKCIIQGPLDSVGFAQSLLQTSLQSALCGPAVRSITIPAAVAGGIVGTRGQNIKELMQKTGVHIRLDAKSDDPTQTTREVTITGSKEGITACVAVIEDRVKHLLSKAKNTSNRPALKRNPQSIASGNFMDEELQYSPSKVLVCAVASPVTLYVQYAGRNSSELGEMIKAMLAFYSDVSGESMSLTHVSSGDMVAVRCFDGYWYRAKVVRVRQSLPPKKSLDDSVTMSSEKLSESSVKKYSENSVAMSPEKSPENVEAMSPEKVPNNSVEITPESSCVLPVNSSRSSCEKDSKGEYEVQKLDAMNGQNLSIHGLLENETPSKTKFPMSIGTQSSIENDAKFQTFGSDTSKDNHKIHLAPNEFTEQVGDNKSVALHALQDLHNNSPAGNSDSDAVKSAVYLVFLVDFGDYHSVVLQDLRELRTDFLRLSHQAFKVQLARVQPVPEMRMAAEFELSLLSTKTSPGEVTAKVVGYLHKDPVPNGSILSHVNGSIPSKHPVEKAHKGTDVQLRDTLTQLKSILQNYGHLKEIVDTESVMTYLESNGGEHLRETEEKFSLLEAEVFYLTKLMENIEILATSSHVSNNNDLPTEEEQKDLKYETSILILLWKELSAGQNDWQNLDQLNWSELCSLIENQHGLDWGAELSVSETEQLRSDIASREASLRQLRWFDYLLRSVERLAFETSTISERPSEPVPLVKLCYRTRQQSKGDSELHATILGCVHGRGVEGLPISASSQHETRNSSYSVPGFEPAVYLLKQRPDTEHGPQTTRLRWLPMSTLPNVHSDPVNDSMQSTLPNVHSDPVNDSRLSTHPNVHSDPLNDSMQSTLHNKSERHSFHCVLKTWVHVLQLFFHAMR